jgi:hypothetical protein
MSADKPAPAAERQIARIALAGERGYVGAALAFIRELAERVGLGVADIAGLERATEAVCLNVIENGFEPGQPASFDVIFLRRPGQLVVAVEDRGLPFDWSRLETRSALSAPPLTAGIDTVRFVNLGVQGGHFERRLETAPASSALPLAAQLSVEVFPKWSEAALRVTTYGADLAELVRFRLRELRLRHIDWISLDLPLAHPGAQQLCASVEALGFFFAGIIPELVGDDVLRLQYLNEVEADLDSVHLASAFSQELFAYVVQAMKES